MAGDYLNFSWVERVHKNVVLGFDYMRLLSQSFTAFGYGAQLNFNNSNFYAQYMPSQMLFMMGYDLKLKNKTKLVTSFSYEQQKQKTTAIVGFKKQLQGNELTATINSRGKVATSLSIMLGQTIPAKLRLCSVVDYYNDSYKFGYGLSFGA